MTSNSSEPNQPDAHEQLARGLGFLGRALRSWPIVLCTVLVGAVACTLFLHWYQPRYRSETVIFYAEKSSAAEGGEPTATRAVTIRLKELLMSRPTLERVIMKFDPYPDLRRTQGTVEAVEELKKHVDFRAPGGDTISIAFEGSSPSQVQNITAELARLVIESDSGLRKSEASTTLEFLSGEKQATESRLREAEQELASFMAQHPRFALDATPLSNGAAIRATLGAAPPSGPAAGGLLRLPSPRALGAPAPASPLAAPRPGEALARAAVAAARENLAEQLAHYTPAHPDVRAAQRDLDRANQRLAALESGQPVAERPADAPVAAGTPAPLPPKAPLVFAQAPPATPPPPGEQAKELIDLETQWLRLTRTVTEAHQRQDQVEAQLFKADIESSSERAGRGAQVSTIDPAFLPERALPPGRTLIALLFLAGSLAIGSLGALLRAVFDDRLFSARDLVGVGEVLVEIPSISRERSARGTT